MKRMNALLYIIVTSFCNDDQYLNDDHSLPPSPRKRFVAVNSSIVMDHNSWQFLCVPI